MLESISLDTLLAVELYASEHDDGTTAQHFELAPDTISRYRRELKRRGYDFGKLRAAQKVVQVFGDDVPTMLASGRAPAVCDSRTAVDFDGDTLRFVACGDTHWGSHYTPEEWWDAVCREAEAFDAEFLLHVGDLVEGMSNRAGHVYELSHIGYDAQKEYAVEQMSKCPVPVYCIDGNHDRWFKKSNGALIVKDIAKECEGVTFLGHDTATLTVGGIDIMLWHGEDGACFDDQTEIQTREGWKLFSDLEDGDEVATMTKDGHIFEWQKPTNIVNQQYAGPMVYFKSRTVDCMVTPNHGMWTRVSDSYTWKRKDMLTMPSKSHGLLSKDWQRKTAAELVNEYSRQKWQFTKAVDGWHGEDPDCVKVDYRESKNPGVNVHHYGDLKTTDAAELIAWYVTEGHARDKDTTISQYKSVNPENYTRIKNLAKRIGGGYGTNNKGITLHSVELSEWVRAQAGHKSRNKYLPEWLKECSKETLEIVVQTMVAGDGWKINGKSYGYRSISKRLLNDFVEIAVKCGYGVSFDKDGEQVRISKGQVTPTVNKRPVVKMYNGTIHCCEVPNGLIHVRRNGKTLWTHNSYAHSYRPQKVIEALPADDLPAMALMGHTHKRGQFEVSGVEVLQTGSIQQQSPWMRSTRKAAHNGFYLVELTINEGAIKRITTTWNKL